MAKIIVYDQVGMSAINRCDRCRAQAHVEVILPDGKGKLLFCIHHADKAWQGLLALDDAVIHDHHPYFEAQQKGVTSDRR